MAKSSVFSIELTSWDAGRIESKSDLLAVEEPLEIQLVFGPEEKRQRKSFVVTMRTPGLDFELATGLLFSEGIIHKKSQIINMKHCENTSSQLAKENILRIALQSDVKLDWNGVERNMMAYAACGLCGKTSIESLQKSIPDSCHHDPLHIDPKIIVGLSDTLHAHQMIFRNTGGLHAAALFDTEGKLLLIKEDVGRHNAMDKMLGAAMGQKRLPLSDYIVFWSGRGSFELVQKALMGGVSTIVSVGPPSSLAVQLAQTFNLILIGFAKGNRFNVYSGENRLHLGNSVQSLSSS